MSARAASPFSRFGVLAILIVGFSVFGAILYFIGVGDTSDQGANNGRAHAASKGLNGYSALVELVEADGWNVDLSRQQTELQTPDILVLTPPGNMNPQELTEILEDREWAGPTLVILPKWSAMPARFSERLEDPDSVQSGWVLLGDAGNPRWADEDSGPLALGVERAGVPVETLPLGEAAPKNAQPLPQEPGAAFTTRGPISGIAGVLPSRQRSIAAPDQAHVPLVVDEEGNLLALALGEMVADENAEEWEVTEPLIFVVEPDLMNNWGLSDPARAQTALSIINLVGGDYADRFVFDLTTNGLGGTLNLLTFAFRPPFFAATICLCLAMIILAWRAFFRFGTPAAKPRETAFGKEQLVINGADLIVRGNRLGLLLKPYAALSARRTAHKLGIKSTEVEAIDNALAARKSELPSFGQSVEQLTKAQKPDTILSAARSLYQHGTRAERPNEGNPDA